MSNVLSSNLFSGFSKLNRDERFQRLLAMGALTQEDVLYLQNSVGKNITNLAEHLVENVIGCFPLPLGVAANFHIDGKDYAIPMAVEETSIIAAVSNMAKWIREKGEITTKAHGKNIIGQIQIAQPKDLANVKKLVEQHAASWIEMANTKVVANLVARGGGVKSIEVRSVPRDNSSHMIVLHVFLDPCDAMGANLVNQVCEFLKAPIEAVTGEVVTMSILSNLVDSKLTEANVVIRNIDSEVGQAIAEASLFAHQDPYRAATHNKGVLNGIDPILIATGNDWRAVEAGVHAYAARSGQYRSITEWKMQGKDLVGKIIAPIILGTVGGVTRVHPTAQLCLKMLKVEKAEELARVIAAVGLVQNLGALKALTSAGIVHGHMKLHIRNLLLAVGATPEEQAVIYPYLAEFLSKYKKITQTDVDKILKQWRQTSQNEKSYIEYPE